MRTVILVQYPSQHQTVLMHSEHINFMHSLILKQTDTEIKGLKLKLMLLSISPQQHYDTNYGARL